jgi:dihydrofolate synthase/folylpolyglutamate synthase
VVGDPTLVLDGAHNPGAARALAASLAAFFGEAPKTLVVGVSRDKDVAGLLAVLAPAARRLILTASSSPRAVPPEALRPLVPASGAEISIAGSVPEALDMAAMGNRTPIVCVAGSLFVVGDALRALGGSDKPCRIEERADSIEALF